MSWAGPVIWLGLALILGLVHLRLFPYAEDDAYIHFRIARNLLDYGVPYFNPRDAVCATSSVSWTLLVSTLFRLVTRDPRIIAVLNSVLTVAGAWLWTKLLRRLTPDTPPSAIYWLFALLYIAVIAIPSIGLMETPLAMLLLAGGLLLLLDQHAIGFAVLAAMAFTRLECSVFLVAILAYWLLRRALPWSKTVLWSAIGALPFAAFWLHYWGTLIPNTVVAKQHAYDITHTQVLLGVVDSLFRDVTLGDWTWIVPEWHRLGYFVALGVVVACLMGWMEVRSRADDRQRMLFGLLLCGAAIAGAYIWRRVLIFSWYVPLYAVPILFGLCGILLRSQKLPRWILLAAMSPWILSMLGGFSQVALSAATNDLALYPSFSTGARVRKYIQLGEMLYKQYPEATLLTSEIGGLGYGFAGYIFDGLGLVSPEAIQFHPMAVPEERSGGYLGAIPVGFVKLVNPDIVVSYEIFIEAFLRSDYTAQYSLIQEPIFLEDDLERSPDKEIWRSSNLYVFIRKGLKPYGSSQPLTAP